VTMNIVHVCVTPMCERQGAKRRQAFARVGGFV